MEDLGNYAEGDKQDEEEEKQVLDLEDEASDFSMSMNDIAIEYEYSDQYPSPFDDVDSIHYFGSVI